MSSKKPPSAGEVSSPTGGGYLQDKTGFPVLTTSKISELKTNDIKDFYDLPPLETIVPQFTKTEDILRKEEAFMEFIVKHNIVQVLTKSIVELYDRFEHMEPHPCPIECFLEALAEHVPVDHRQSELDLEVDLVYDQVMDIREEHQNLLELVKKQNPKMLEQYRYYKESISISASDEEEEEFDSNAKVSLGSLNSSIQYGPPTPAQLRLKRKNGQYGTRPNTPGQTRGTNTDPPQVVEEQENDGTKV